ncbi:MAG: transglutaminase-like domain-containing protein [Thermoanaerobaculia bacterium]
MNLIHRLLIVLAALTFAVAAEASEGAPEQELASLQASYEKAYTAGAYQEALELLRRIDQFPQTRADARFRAGVTFRMACLHALLGRRDEAMAGLRAALAAGHDEYESYATDRSLDSLRGDADFEALMLDLRHNRQFRAVIADLNQQARSKPLPWDESQPSPAFTLQFDDPGIAELIALRAEFAIDPVVAEAPNDLDRLIRLTRWTSEQWEHHSSQTASKRDPFTILREAKAGGKFLCHDFAVTLAGVVRAYGLYARHVMALPKDVETRSESHSVTEVWLPELGKWVIADGQFGIVPEVGGVPVSAIELQRAIADGAQIVCRGAAERCAEWKRFIQPNLYYFKVAQDQRRFRGEASRQLVLGPKGAPKPRKFGGENERVFADSIYTSNPSAFYADPSSAVASQSETDLPVKPSSKRGPRPRKGSPGP